MDALNKRTNPAGFLGHTLPDNAHRASLTASDNARGQSGDMLWTFMEEGCEEAMEKRSPDRFDLTPFVLI
jgi:hypothetical protein